jgi:hypothetical protein
MILLPALCVMPAKISNSSMDSANVSLECIRTLVFANLVTPWPAVLTAIQVAALYATQFLDFS